MDEMEIISLHKRCNKKVSHPKKEPFKSDEPKKAPKLPELVDDPSEQEQKSKKKSRPSDEKKSATKAGIKVKKTSQLKKAPKLPEFIASGEEEEGLNKMKKMSPLLWVKEEAQSFFDLWKDSKSLTIEKEAERVFFMRGPYKGQELSNVALCDTEYFKKALKRSDLDQNTKSLIKQVQAKA